MCVCVCVCVWLLTTPFVVVVSFCYLFIYFSSIALLLPTHLPPPSCTHAQSCNPMDFSPPDSSVHGLFQARILEWVVISFSIFLFFNMLNKTCIESHFLKKGLQTVLASRVE